MQTHLSQNLGNRNINLKLILQGGGVVIFGEVDHLEIEARTDRIWEGTEGIKTTADSDLEDRI